MAVVNPMVTKLKKVQSIVKKLKKEKPRLTHTEALKLAWKQLPKAKAKAGKIGTRKKTTAKKRPVNKVTETEIKSRTKKLRDAAIKLDDKQGAHILNQIGSLLQKRYLLKHFVEGKLKDTIPFKAANLATAKKVVKTYKLRSAKKGRYSLVAQK
jgi:hypothetical protein